MAFSVDAREFPAKGVCRGLPRPENRRACGATAASCPDAAREHLFSWAILRGRMSHAPSPLAKEDGNHAPLRPAHVSLFRGHYRRPCPGNTVTILPSSCLILSRCTCFIPSPGYHDCPSALVALYGHGACTLRALLTAEVNSACAALATRPPESARGRHLRPRNTKARLPWTRCTGCGACTEAVALNAASELRLLTSSGPAA